MWPNRLPVRRWAVLESWPGTLLATNCQLPTAFSPLQPLFSSRNSPLVSNRSQSRNQRCRRKFSTQSLEPSGPVHISQLSLAGGLFSSAPTLVTIKRHERVLISVSVEKSSQNAKSSSIFPRTGQARPSPSSAGVLSDGPEILVILPTLAKTLRVDRVATVPR